LLSRSGQRNGDARQRIFAFFLTDFQPLSSIILACSPNNTWASSY